MSFKISSRFISTASSINVINVDKFSKLLIRIIQKLHIRDERLFTIEEENQLKSVFNVTDETLRLIIDACCYIFEQAAFSGIGPEPLYETLLAAGIDEQHSKVYTIIIIKLIIIKSKRLLGILSSAFTIKYNK